MADISKPLKDVTNTDARDLLYRAVKTALQDELKPLVDQLKRIADALEKQKP